jgi:polyhydroxyalkanoate synthesis regulator phasin
MSDKHTDSRPSETVDHLVEAYERMLKRTRERLDEAEDAAPKLRDWLAKARDHMVELGELTREEANKISEYIERDIEDAAHYLADTGEDLKTWWRFDLQLIEDRLLDAFTSVADQTSLQLRALAERAQQARAERLYQSGEITGPGTLVCNNCGARLHFQRATRIPDCAECGGRDFRRDRA